MLGANKVENYLENFAEEIFEVYKDLKIPNKFTLVEVDKILKEQYSAIEEDINLADIEDGVRNNAVKYYKITDIQVLEGIFTSIEKLDLYNIRRINKNEPHNFIYDIERMWNDIEEGRRLNIILESEDNKLISGFTLQGMSEKLFNLLSVFVGIESSFCHLGNEMFHEYMKRLILAEYIR